MNDVKVSLYVKHETCSACGGQERSSFSRRFICSSTFDKREKTERKRLNGHNDAVAGLLGFFFFIP